MITGMISVFLHEAGHVLFYLIQDIPARMSLVMEFPLIDISYVQYGIGSAGGPLTNILLIFGAWFFSKRFEKKSTGWNISSAFIISNSFYLVFRGILGIVKNDGGEIESSMNLIGLNFYYAAILFFIISITILTLWIQQFKIKWSLMHIFYYFFLFVSYLGIILILETVDKKYFWNKYPTINIGNDKVHNSRD